MKIKEKFRCLAECGLNLIYPHRCPICHEILRNQKTLICQSCFADLRPIGEPKCRICGRPVKEEKEKCPDCEKTVRFFAEGRGIFLYSEEMRKSILLFKYEGRREYARFFSAAMGIYAQKEILRWRPDLLIPIPLHKRKQKQRGFNQAEILAGKIGRLYGIPVETKILIKRVATKSQKKLGAKERKRNLKAAFAVKKNVKNLRILLIDDVFTTGSTIDAAAETLREAGASMVFFLTLCMAADENG